MKAIRIHQYGGPEVLTYEDAPAPTPGDGEVLVRVYATSVNPIDGKIRGGYLRQFVSHELPLIPGWDLSGVVEALGPDARGFEVGDEVFARPDVRRDGAWAELIVVRAEELAHKPRAIDHIHAASVPLAGLTAYQMLFNETAIALQTRQTILIHDGAGGVGSFAVQLAHGHGAHVIATASGANIELLRDLGADEVIDYTKQRFEDLVWDVDAVLDTVGGDTLARSWRVVRRGGMLASTVTQPSERLAARHGVRAAHGTVETKVADLDELARLIDINHLRPIVSQVIPLADARRAHELSEAGHVRGKIVLRVAS